jgi:hypothetical protein
VHRTVFSLNSAENSTVPFFSLLGSMCAVGETLCIRYSRLLFGVWYFFSEAA